MNFDNYQKQALKTKIYPEIFVKDNKGNLVRADWIYPVLSVGGETGELQNLLKKCLRDQKGTVSDEVKEKVKCELGGQLWYIAAICEEFGLTLDEVAKYNIDALKSRQERGTLSGSGDKR